ncbi:MAG: hypothetical protein LBD98_03200 [Endomicrobium sp.]|jgi:hypothetical protein|nr:hypothetical protein [Endomicrobium sp.]
MNALQIIKTAARRIGIVPPKTLANVNTQDASLYDADAAILLEALNETIHGSLTIGVADRFKIFVNVVPEIPTPDNPNVPLLGISSMRLAFREVAPSFASFISSGFIGQVTEKLPDVITQKKIAKMFYEMEYDKFMTLNSNNGINAFAIVGDYAYIVTDLDFEKTYDISSLIFSFGYKSLFGVRESNGLLPPTYTYKYSFEKNDDESLSDSELLILGTVCNYKSYMGIDYQFDSQKFQAYIAALQKNMQRGNLIKDNSLKIPFFNEVKLDPNLN